MGLSPECGKHLGLLAQEVEDVCPGAVDTAQVDEFRPELRQVTTVDGDEQVNQVEFKTLKTEVIMFKMLGALQESMKRIEELEAKVAALEGT